MVSSLVVAAAAAAAAAVAVLTTAPASVAAHGRLAVPTPRDVAAGTINNGVAYAPIRDNGVDTPLLSGFQCRDLPAGPVQATLTVGEPVVMRTDMQADHIGDCSVYLSYDAGVSWFKISNQFECREQNGQDVNVMIPDWLPACTTGCILRWEWVALHVPATPEWYAQCVDVTINRNTAGGALPAANDMWTIPGHLSAARSDYREVYVQNPTNFISGPCVAVAPTQTQDPSCPVPGGAFTGPLVTSSSGVGGTSSGGTPSPPGSTAAVSGGGTGSCQNLAAFCQSVCGESQITDCRCDNNNNPIASCAEPAQVVDSAATTTTAVVSAAAIGAAAAAAAR